MQMLSEDDVNLRELSDKELDLAWDLWFDLAQATNDWDPPYCHGVFVNLVTSARGNPQEVSSEGVRRDDHM
jgi:hypothetical protein